MIGSKAQVFNGTADRTAGGLRKGDLMKIKGRIVSKKKHQAGKKLYANMSSETKQKFKAQQEKMKKGLI